MSLSRKEREDIALVATVLLDSMSALLKLKFLTGSSVEVEPVSEQREVEPSRRYRSQSVSPSIPAKRKTRAIAAEPLKQLPPGKKRK